MAATLIIRPEAEQDLDQAYAWYESRQAGLGDRFLNAVEARIANVLRSSKIGRVVQGPYRRVVVAGFPYVLFYRHDDSSDTVIVHCVFHTSQNPSRWQQRLP